MGRYLYLCTGVRIVSFKYLILLNRDMACFECLHFSLHAFHAALPCSEVKQNHQLHNLLPHVLCFAIVIINIIAISIHITFRGETQVRKV